MAEVLITLGIIGIVAAMTIPTLVTNYKIRLVETRLLRTYSIISQALLRAEIDYGEGFTVDIGEQPQGDINGYSWELSHRAFEKYFKPYIRTVHTYTEDEMSNLVMYFGSTKVSRPYFAWYDLLDGTRLGYQQSGNYSGIKFIVIPTPNKRKIIGGVDTFFIEFRPINGTYKYYPYWYSKYEKGTITRESLIEYCGANIQWVANASSPDSYCFQLLKDNSFKVPADYPLKF